ncbi:MAG: hypothetical protein AAB426_04505 [Myxococcota bacterium]
MVGTSKIAGGVLALLAVTALAKCSRSGFESIELRNWLLNRSWVELGNSATGGGVTDRGADVCCPRVGIDRLGVPHLLWADRHDGSWNVYLARWDASVWTSLAGSNDPGGLSQIVDPYPTAAGTSNTGDVVFDAANRPIAVWSHYGPSGRVVYVRRFDGSSWQELGGSASGGGISGATNAWWPRARVDAAGQLLVAWEAWNSAVTGTIFLSRWDGSQWSGLGGSDAGEGVSGPLGNAHEVAVNTDGSRVTLSWQANAVSSVDDVYLRQWNGSSWQALGGSDTDGGISSSAAASQWSSSAVDGAGAPTVVWQEDTADGPDIHLLQWRQGAWQPLGDSLSLRQLGLASDDPQHPTLASTSDGALVVAWAQGPANAADIHAAAWVDGLWYPIGATPGSSDLSETPTHSDWPVLTAGPDGEIYVTWVESVAADVWEVYVKVRR